MNETIGLLLVVYGLLLAGLSCLIHHLAPDLALPTLIVGVAGAVLCLALGIQALRGRGGKALAILTLIPVNFVMLSQTLMSWMGGTLNGPGRRTAAALISVLLALSMGMLVRIAWAGVVFDVASASPAKKSEAKSQAAKKPIARDHAFKEA